MRPVALGRHQSVRFSTTLELDLDSYQEMHQDDDGVAEAGAAEESFGDDSDEDTEEEDLPME